MSERFKVQSWKGCVSKGTGGSNPPLSAFQPGTVQLSSAQPRQDRKVAAVSGSQCDAVCLAVFFGGFMRRIFLAVLLFSLFLQPAVSQGVTFYPQTTTAYVESLEDPESLELLFSDATGKIPYVSLQDGLDFLYGEGEYQSKVEDGLFVVTRSNGAYMAVDVEEETIYFSDYDLFLKQPDAVTLLDIVLDDTIIHHEPLSFESKGRPLNIDYGTFLIDVFLADDECLLPLQTFSDIFGISALGALLYNGEDLFFVSSKSCLKNYDDTLTEMGEKYYSVKPSMLDKDFADFNYRELGLNLQLNYGLAEKHNITTKIHDWFEMLDLEDKLSSIDPMDADQALAEICYKYFGDLHSAFHARSPYTGLERESEDIVPGPSVKKFIQNMGEILTARSEFFPDGVPGFQRKGDTAYITFDDFWMDRSRNYFEEPLTRKEKQAIQKDYASSGIDTIGLIHYANEEIQSNPRIKNVVIDISCNTGGALDAEVFVASWLLGQSSLAVRRNITDCQSVTSYTADVNFDGKCGQKDDYVGDRRIFCLISGNTFSCGNLLASMLAESGKAALIGTKTGGGACAVYLTSTAAGALFQTSSPWLFSSERNGAFFDIEAGVVPDYKLTGYSAFFDRSEKKGLTAYIRKLY